MLKSHGKVIKICIEWECSCGTINTNVLDYSDYHDSFHVIVTESEYRYADEVSLEALCSGCNKKRTLILSEN